MDMFSLGLTFINMLGINASEAQAMISNSDNLVFGNILEGKYPLILPLIKQMVKKNPFERITFQNLYNSLFDLKNSPPEQEAKFIAKYEYKIGKSYIPCSEKEIAGRRNVLETTAIKLGIVSEYRCNIIKEMYNLIWDAEMFYMKNNFEQAIENIEAIRIWYENEFGRNLRLFQKLDVLLIYLYHVSQDFDKFQALIKENYLNSQEISELFSQWIPEAEYSYYKDRIQTQSERLLTYNISGVFCEADEFFVMYFDPTFFRADIVHKIYEMENLNIVYHSLCILVKQKLRMDSCKFMEFLIFPQNFIFQIGNHNDFLHLKLLNQLYCEYDYENFCNVLNKIEKNQDKIYNYLLVKGQILLFYENSKKKNCLSKGFNLSILYLEKLLKFSTTDLKNFSEYYENIAKMLYTNLEIYIKRDKNIRQSKILF